MIPIKVTSGNDVILCNHKPEANEMKRHPKLSLLLAAGLCMPLLTAGASEEGHGEGAGDDGHRAEASAPAELETMEDLREEVRALREAVRSLQATRPTTTALMPDFAERFHVIHYAGEAGDWAVATHELLEMERIMKVIGRVNSEYGEMMQGFMSPSFDALNAAIEHGDRGAFNDALTGTVEQCNACHTAVGSGFVEVTLDVDESLSMRHPHRLQPSEKPGDHTHSH